MSTFGMWLGLAFFPNGRIDRRQFWLVTLANLVASFATSAMFNAIDPSKHPGLPASIVWPVALLTIVGALAEIYVGVATAIKRLHDRDKGGAWYLVGLIPILGWLWLLAELGFRRGDPGVNRFGPAPARPLATFDR